MPQPTRGDVHVDSALTDVSVATIQEETNFIAGQVFPGVPVVHRSDEYFIYTASDWRRDEAKPRAPGAESAGGGYDLTTATYTCKVYAFHKDVADQIRGNADPALDMDGDATVFVTHKLLIQKEVDWATKYFTTSLWGTDVTGGTNFTKWDEASSDPEKDVENGRQTILKKTGRKPNTLTVGSEVHAALKRHPLVKDKYKHTSSESISRDMLARFFEVDRYLVGEASYDSAAEGATDSDAFILGKHALLTFSAARPSLILPSAGYTFNWSQFSGANNGVRVKNFRMEKNEADRIEGQWAYDQKLVSSNSGYFFSTCVT